MPIVMFYGDSPRYVLTGISRGPDGAITGGDVENGQWRLKVDGGDHAALDTYDRERHRWPVDPKTVNEIRVPPGGDYNEIMARAVEMHRIAP